MIKILTVLIAATALLSQTGFAHSGRTNSSGCHNDRKNGGYHCHRAKQLDSSEIKQETAANTESVKGTKSKDRKAASTQSQTSQ